MKRLKSEFVIKIDQLVLGSTSKFRAALLAQAGIRHFKQVASGCDEQTITHKEPARQALLRAEAKASAVPVESRSLVIGADQVLEFEGKSYGKADSAKIAEERLREMSGKTHYLHSAFALAHMKKDNLPEIVHSEVVTVSLTMRELSLTEVKNYVATGEWRGCAGCYQFENIGINLFQKINGTTDAVIGMPLIPLLTALRNYGINPIAL